MPPIILLVILHYTLAYLLLFHSIPQLLTFIIRKCIHVLCTHPNSIGVLAYPIIPPIILYHTPLYNIIPYCTLLYHIIQYDTLLYHIIPYYTSYYTSYHTLLYPTIPQHTLLYILLYPIIPYYTQL